MNNKQAIDSVRESVTVTIRNSTRATTSLYMRLYARDWITMEINHAFRFIPTLRDSMEETVTMNYT